jgi:hypothetical protein
MSLHTSPQIIPARLDEKEGRRSTSSINLRIGGMVCPHCPPDPSS